MTMRKKKKKKKKWRWNQTQDALNEQGKNNIASYPVPEHTTVMNGGIMGRKGENTIDAITTATATDNTEAAAAVAAKVAAVHPAVSEAPPAVMMKAGSSTARRTPAD
jgi:hypothetical protein